MRQRKGLSALLLAALLAASSAQAETSGPLAEGVKDET